jgi:hypothetical protein
MASVSIEYSYAISPLQEGVTLLISWHAGVPELFSGVDSTPIPENSEGAEIIPHELERYHERVRSRYEIIRKHS